MIAVFVWTFSGVVKAGILAGLLMSLLTCGVVVLIAGALDKWRRRG